MKKAIQIILISTLAMLLVSGCGGGSTKLFTGTPETGLSTMYTLNKDATLNYDISTETIISMEMMGQTMEMNNTVSASLGVTGQGISKENVIETVVTLNDAKLVMTGPQGTTEPDMSAVKGKTFNMSMSPMGEENFEGLDSLKVNFGPMAGGEQSPFKQAFQIFPNLPEKPVKIGDTWTKADTTKTMQMGNEMNVIINTNYTFEGVEVIDAIPCMKIAFTGEGTIDGGGEQQGAKFNIEGDIETSGAYYFAYEIGQLIKQESTNIMEGSAAVSGAANMTIPMSTETITKVNLIK